MRRRVIDVLLAACLLSASCAKQAADTDAPWPEWAFHHWVWENESTQESAIALVDDYLSRDIPVGAIIIDSPWETSYNSFEFDTDRFPDPQEMVDYFHDHDVRVFLWITSAINTDSPLYAEAAGKGFFMQTGADAGPGIIDWWKGEGSLIDYFNPEAVEWWHTHMDEAIALGIDGWKCDGTDPWVIGVPYSPGLGANVTRNEYGHAYYQDSFDYLREHLGADRIITARPVDNLGNDSGADIWSFAPREINWAGWVGDQDGTFEGLADALNNLYWSSERGYVAHGSDIGGFRTDDTVPEGRTKEVFIRWAQMGALSPVMENGGGGEHRPWMFDAETTDIYRKFTELHHRLVPYLMEQGGRAFHDGTSLTTFLNRSDYTYLLGRDVFVAPMLGSGTTRALTFPDHGRWVYVFDPAQVYEAGTETTLDVPLDEFPAFVREGSQVAATLVE